MIFDGVDDRVYKGYIDVVSAKANIIYMEFLTEIKNEHNLKDSIYELENKYFTSYLYILKNVKMYTDKMKADTGHSAYVRIRDWEDFKFMLKKKVKNLID